MAEMVEATLNGRYKMILPKHRADRPEWYDELGWEKKRLDHIHDCITKMVEPYLMLRGGPHQDDVKKPIMYYVGSEESEMPALCQMWGANVVLLEPNPKVWSNAKAIWEANKLHFPLALFEGFASNTTTESSKSALYFDDWMPHANEEVIGNHGFKELYLEAESYPQIKLDDLAKYQNIGSPDIISMDCEGSEFEILKGAESILMSDHKPIIYLSLHPEFLFSQWGVYSAELRRWIIDKGYNEELIDYALHETHLVYRPIL
jgi:FkbM family methyltransferase